MKNYELIEHTADIGIRVKAASLKDLFKNSAAAMFDIMAEKIITHNPARRELTVKQEGDNSEELLVNWLNELLFLSATRELIFEDFKIEKLEDKSLEAKAVARPLKDFKIKTEIKAATYHELKIEKLDSDWQAQVIFDV